VAVGCNLGGLFAAHALTWYAIMNKNHRVGVAVATDWHRLKGGTVVRRCARHECVSQADNTMTALSQPWPILRRITLGAVVRP
jgi:hypothetical protein